eukprot:361839-Chlamydomonas_euryale.AAC.14
MLYAINAPIKAVVYACLAAAGAVEERNAHILDRVAQGGGAPASCHSNPVRRLLHFGVELVEAHAYSSSHMHKFLTAAGDTLQVIMRQVDNVGGTTAGQRPGLFA